MDADVQMVKEWLYLTIIYGSSYGPIQGTLWEKFTAPQQVRRSAVLRRVVTRGSTPWAKMQDCMLPRVPGAEAFPAFIRRHLDIHVTW